jgi:hypothetical protein
MLHIMLACVRTHELVSTGIETDLHSFIALPEVLSLLQCPACATLTIGPRARRGFVKAPINCPLEWLAASYSAKRRGQRKFY